MVVTNLPWSSEIRKPWHSAPAARSSAVKPKLRLHTDNESTPPPLKFTAAETATGRQAAEGPATQPDKLDVEHAIEDAQKRLDDLRKLLFPEDDDRGPFAA